MCLVMSVRGEDFTKHLKGKSKRFITSRFFVGVIMSISDLSRSQLEDIIENWVINDTNCERNRFIIKDRLLNGYTYEKLAEKYELSEQQIKNIVNKCRKIIINHLEV